MKSNDWVVQVGELLEGEVGGETEISRKVQINDKFEEFTFPYPVKIDIFLQKVDMKSLLGNFTISGKISGSCFRCLKNVEKDISYHVTASFCEENNKNCDEKIIASTINFKNLVYQTIELEKSLKYLCRESCKGLCPNCGEDLNKGKCKCDK